jgi:hypothetical protein
MLAAPSFQQLHAFPKAATETAGVSRQAVHTAVEVRTCENHLRAASGARLSGYRTHARVLRVARSRVQVTAFFGHYPPGLLAHWQHR